VHREYTDEQALALAATPDNRSGVFRNHIGVFCNRIGVFRGRTARRLRLLLRGASRVPLDRERAPSRCRWSFQPVGDRLIQRQRPACREGRVPYFVAERRLRRGHRPLGRRPLGHGLGRGNRLANHAGRSQ
jgi:hypothetical protein